MFFYRIYTSFSISLMVNILFTCKVGMEGKGLEPTVEALFGENGFFPDTVLKTVYFVSDKMPLQVNEVMKRMMPALKKDRMKRQVFKTILCSSSFQPKHFN